MINQTDTKIENEKSIRFENLMSLRKKMDSNQVNSEIIKIAKFLDSNGINKNGPMITATFGEEVVDGKHIVDMEILVPIDRKVSLPKPYVFKELFHLVHAVYARNVGDIKNLEKMYYDLQKYIEDNLLQRITAVYLVHVNDEYVMHGEIPIIDVYIGVNPSIL